MKPEEVVKNAIGIEWRDTESMARRVAEYSAKRITELELERNNYRAVLEGAEYGDIDGIGKSDPELSYLLGVEVKRLTVSLIKN